MDKKIKNGIYEEVVSESLHESLTSLSNERKNLEKIDKSEAPIIFADYARKILESRLRDIQDKKASSIEEQRDFINKVLAYADKISGEGKSDKISEESELLMGILDEKSAEVLKQKADEMTRPQTSVAGSSLFTGAHHEPTMISEINKEISSCDRVDMVVSFIRKSGVNMILDRLKRFTESGKRVRIITTSYMGATEFTAIQQLADLPNTEIKISYDTERTRLHAKVYIFHRDTGYSTAYVGSSNLTSPAMTSGCEWNIKVSKQDQSEVFEKVISTFEGYWNAEEFEPYTPEVQNKLKEALNYAKNRNTAKQSHSYYFEARPYPYQQAILDQIAVERKIRNSYKNLVVAATGTGKTIIAAFDYKRICRETGKRPTLLFIAHRKEILEQSIECFREVLNDSGFADLLVGSCSPSQYKYLFVSIDMLNSRSFINNFSADYYEYIVFDECHHIAAKTYQEVLKHFKPSYLLGLTATPDRMDGEPILQFFNNRIAAEIPLFEAIDRKLLCPFQYYGVADDVDLTTLKWSRGGYDTSELENIYVFDTEIAKKRARLIINSMKRYLGDFDDLKAIAFCVSVSHAEFMSKQFKLAGIEAAYVSAQTTQETRTNIKNGLERGLIKIVCAVDLYNEGVDIKQVNTVLFLRPTESMTIFLQQLGRGLRLSDGKDCLTVLDFIGQANKKYDFGRKYKALLKASNQGLKKEVEEDFPHMPKGCYIHLEKKAKDIILKNISSSVTEKKGILNRISSFEEDTGKELTLKNFLETYEISPKAFYAQKFKWSFEIAKHEAGLGNELIFEDSDCFKVLFRILSTDDLEFIRYFRRTLWNKNRVSANMISEQERQYWNMLYGSLYDDSPKSGDTIALVYKYFNANKTVYDELKYLLEFMEEHTSKIYKNHSLPFENVLKVHCTYTRRQILATFDLWKIISEGVAGISNKKTTCLFVTLNKSDSYYSPTTSYHDYSITDELFHWQSQNATSDTSEVGLRYINESSRGENILLFVREQKKDEFGSSAPFTFLGRVHYVSHTGNKPMSITWRLEERIPAAFMPVTDQLGIG